MPERRNKLLSSLFEAGLRPQLEPLLKSVDLRRGQELAAPEKPLRDVYFPHAGVISFAINMKDGHSVQTGTIGYDGAIGSLHSASSPSTVLVQVSGQASVIDVKRFEEIADNNIAARHLARRNEQYFSSEVQVTAACNAVHSIEQRVCRWLLRMNDLVGVKVPITQEALSQMIGVRRTSVTMAAQSLQLRGIIKNRRGELAILDIERLRESSCECYELMRQHRVEPAEREAVNV